MNPGLRIIVSGLAGLHPVGGMAWHYLQYLVGLSRLGHDVYYHEDTWSWPYHPVKNTHIETGENSANFIHDFLNRYAPELNGRWHYLHLHDQSYGMPQTAFDEVAGTADLFLNVSGANFIPETLSPSCTKVFLDTDPGYNQIMLLERPGWSEHVDRWCASVAAHDQHFTFAENMHGQDCLVPKLHFDWKTTRMPVVLDLWPHVPSPKHGLPWSTVMTWNAFKGKLLYQGIEYKSKGAEFEKLMGLPKLVGLPLSVAVGGIDAPLQRLASLGWQVFDGPQATLTPSQYAGFITNSRGELSAAKHVYVAMRTGWFSERSACYLASGRPVVAQDTGFSAVLPVGKGLLAFSTLDDAVEAIQRVESDYETHAAAARGIAVDYFDSDKVLGGLIDRVFNGDASVVEKSSKWHG